MTHYSKFVTLVPPNPPYSCVHLRVNAMDLGKQTALHLAAERDRGPSVELLLAHGADSSILDKQGYAPHHVAAAQVRAGSPMHGHVRSSRLRRRSTRLDMH